MLLRQTRPRMLSCGLHVRIPHVSVATDYNCNVSALTTPNKFTKRGTFDIHLSRYTLDYTMCFHECSNRQVVQIL